MTELTKPVLLIPLPSYKKLMAYVDLCVGEVTGFFDVDWDLEKNAFVMSDVYLIKQEAGAADVEMDENDIAEFMEEMIVGGATQLPRGWWHSHVNMGVFWSGTDNATIDNDFTNDTFTLSIVMNKKREIKASLMIWNIVPNDRPYLANVLADQMRIDDLKVEIAFGFEEIPEDLKKEVEKKVKQKKYTYEYQGSGKSFFQGGKNKGVRKVFTLPKDKEAAISKVKALGLIRSLDRILNEIVYVNELNEDIWRDPWKNISWTDYKEITDGNPGETKVIQKARRCLTCNYYEGQHKSDICQIEVYEEKDLAGVLGIGETDDDY